MTVWGIVLAIVSPLVGIVGTVWSIYGSFDTLARSEAAGLDPVGAGLRYAMIFTVFGLLGTVLGTLMIVLGIRKAKA